VPPDIESSVNLGIHHVLSKLRRQRRTHGYGTVDPKLHDRLLQEELDLGNITGDTLREMVTEAVKDATGDILRWETDQAERVLESVDQINRSKIDSFVLHTFIQRERRALEEKRDQL
jgi:hypothetical protein